MPRRALGSRPLRQAPARRVQLADFNLRDKLKFLSNWAPGAWPDSPWTTWAGYLRDYEAVRDELYARFRTGAKARFAEPFAETALRIRNERGLSALEAMTCADIYEERRTPQ